MSSKIRATWEQQCRGKMRYEGKRAAKTALGHIRSAHGGLSPYKCRHCGFYHLGHRRT